MCHDDGNENEMLTYMPFISELSALLVEFVTTEGIQLTQKRNDMLN